MKLDDILKSKELTCAVPHSQVGKMLRLITKSADPEERERAFSFCGDGQELSFPSAIGKPEGVLPPKCPPSKRYMGNFHTHPSGIAEKSAGDWYADTFERHQVSCVGAEEEEATEEKLVYKKTVVCHTFNTEHPEYEDFRIRLMVMSEVAADYEEALAQKPGLITEEARAQQLLYKETIGTLVAEGMQKGIIGACNKISIADVERMMEEQKRPY